MCGCVGLQKKENAHNGYWKGGVVSSRAKANKINGSEHRLDA